jgi:hypothetical protein
MHIQGLIVRKNFGNAGLGRIHLVDNDNELSDTKSKCDEDMLSSRAAPRYTRLILPDTGCHDKNCTISLRSTRNRILNEVEVARGVDDLERI